MKKLFTAALILISSSFLKGQSYISGTISDSTGAAANVGVALFSFNNLSIVDTLLSLDGSYQFNNVDTGQYLVVARGNKLQYPNHIVTYYGQHTKWSAGTIITVQDTNNFPNTDIILIQKPDWSNSDNKGFCSGRIKIGQGLRAGDPIPGIDIALEQIPGGIIKASTTTDSTGLFKIEKIPDNTEYQLIVDIPGYPIDSTHTVKILNSDSVMNLDFVVDTDAGSEGIFVSQEV